MVSSSIPTRGSVFLVTREGSVVYTAHCLIHLWSDREADSTASAAGTHAALSTSLQVNLLYVDLDFCFLFSFRLPQQLD